MRPAESESLADLATILPLARGDLAPHEVRELGVLKEQIRREAGFLCAGYKENCFRRRVAVRMRARGVHRYSEYAALIRGDAEEYALLLRALTINVSRFFRNAEVWEEVRTRVFPAMIGMPSPFLNVWSAASAAGEEAYTIAILLREAADRDPGVNPHRFRIVGTDIDPEALAGAVQAEYGELALAETSPERRERWFVQGKRLRLAPEIRRMARFARHDLISEPFPAKQHLIVCRNAVIYFEREVQERIFGAFRESLVPGGFLLLGKAESLLGATAAGFESLLPAARLYRRLP